MCVYITIFVTLTNLPIDTAKSLSVLLADIDNDGDLDLILTNEGENRFYLNDGKGIFSVM